ncbi:MAG: hypothetical protein KDI19_14520, partial [Pseudomonadales bacterium]|nr:hypothetical protein [Pseudomonadales bacterium]
GIRPDVTLYQLNNTVFNTRLEGTSRAERARNALALAATRPVYSIGVPELPAETDYGLFSRHFPGGGPVAAVDPRHRAFRSAVLKAWQGGDIDNAPAHYFAGQLLLSFANSLLALEATRGLERVDRTDLSDLQQTFPGTLATLSFANANPGRTLRGEALVSLAFDMENRIPADTSLRDQSLFYFHFGLLFSRGQNDIPVDQELARTLLQKSLSVMPGPENPADCELRRLDGDAC